jgi:hypothetical protein
LNHKFENNSINIDDDFILKYKLVEEVDYITIELWTILKDDKNTISDIQIINKFQ